MNGAQEDQRDQSDQGDAEDQEDKGINEIDLILINLQIYCIFFISKAIQAI